MDNKQISFTTQPLEGPNSDACSAEAYADDKQPKQQHDQTIGGGVRGRRSAGPIDKLDRYLATKPIVAFGLTLQASWEALAISFQSTMVNGGPSTLLYGSILSGFASAAMAATLAEMASMKPAVGAQYHWSALLAPKGTNPLFLGYIQGWLTTFAWNAACALNPFLMGSMIQGCIILCNENYVPTGWHTTLLAYASMALPILCNIYARRLIAPLEIAAA